MVDPIGTRTTRDGVILISPGGEVDMSNAFLIREAVDAALLHGRPSKIIIDLNDVTMLDSIGIGVLVACYHAAMAYQVPLAAVRPSATVYRLLWISGLVGLFGLVNPPAENGIVAA